MDTAATSDISIEEPHTIKQVAADKLETAALGEPSRTRSVFRRKKDKLRVTSGEEFEALLAQGVPLFDLDVRGDSYSHLMARDEADLHPVLEVLRDRVAAGSKPGQRTDKFKVGLAIEGGGMRGCVSAGMVASIMSVGAMDCVDAVYGSSAGSLVGAYAIAGQPGMPRLGCSVYYDALTNAGRSFIDTRFLGRAMGVGALAVPFTRRAGLRDLVRDRIGAPVIKLDYLLGDVVERLRPLDWERFWERQRDQPMNIVASGMHSHSSVVLNSAGGHFKTLRELTACMRASMLLPGIAGPMVTLPGVDEPLVDSQLYEPIPYRAALNDGCTHVVVMRSRPDGCSLIGKPKLPERMIAKRYFTKKHGMPAMYTYMKTAGHKLLYARDVLRLNEAATAKAGDKGPFLLPLSLAEGEPEVGRLERDRANILNGVRKGCAYGHDVLRRAAPPRYALRGAPGAAAAAHLFPDEILSFNVDPILADLPGFEGLDVRRVTDDSAPTQ